MECAFGGRCRCWPCGWAIRSGAVWVAPVAGLLLIAVKVIQVIRDAQPKDQLEIMMAAPEPEPSKTQRILWG